MFTDRVHLVNRVRSSWATVLAVSSCSSGPASQQSTGYGGDLGKGKGCSRMSMDNWKPWEAGPVDCWDGGWIWAVGASVKTPSVERVVWMAILARVTKRVFLMFDILRERSCWGILGPS